MFFHFTILNMILIILIAIIVLVHVLYSYLFRKKTNKKVVRLSVSENSTRRYVVSNQMGNNSGTYSIKMCVLAYHTFIYRCFEKYSYVPHNRYYFQNSDNNISIIIVIQCGYRIIVEVIYTNIYVGLPLMLHSYR